MRRAALVFVPVLLLAGACSRAPSEPSSSPQETASTPARPSTSSSVLAPASATARLPHLPSAVPPPEPLALQWDDPHRWERRVPSTPMRKMEYRIPHVAPDKEDGECSVITFGPNQGGSVDDNVARWVKQMQAAPSAASQTTRTVHGMKVTRVEVPGTYTAMAMPSMPGSPPRPGYRLVGDIVETPSGLWFFKLTAPDATAKVAGKELDGLIDSTRPR